MKKNDSLLDNFKNFEIDKQLVKANHGGNCTTQVVMCSQNECGSDDREFTHQDCVEIQ